MARKSKVETPDLQTAEFVCIAKCFFNSVLWKPGEGTGYILGIEDCEYFKQI